MAVGTREVDSNVCYYYKAQAPPKTEEKLIHDLKKTWQKKTSEKTHQI